jgi:hypothetical protein
MPAGIHAQRRTIRDEATRWRRIEVAMIAGRWAATAAAMFWFNAITAKPSNLQ